MQNNRRKLIVAGGLVAGGFAVGTLQALASGGQSPEGDVAAVIARYGESVKVTVGADSGVHYRVKMHGIEKFVRTFDAEKGLPFERIRVCAGNTLKFSHRGVDFTIVNVA